MPAYAVSKYGVAAFSDALRREMFPWGVRVSIIEAGAYKTKLLTADNLAEQWRSEWNELSDEVKQEYGEEGLQKGNYKLQDNEKTAVKITRGRAILQTQSPGSSPTIASDSGMNGMHLIRRGENGMSHFSSDHATRPTTNPVNSNLVPIVLWLFGQRVVATTR